MDMYEIFMENLQIPYEPFSVYVRGLQIWLQNFDPISDKYSIAEMCINEDYAQNGLQNYVGMILPSLSI
jgi:hypothetical protein